MAAALHITPKTKRPAGDPCTCAPVTPALDDATARRLLDVAKALADPVRLRLVDVLRDHPGRLCPCELAPLFGLTQPTISHHLKVSSTPAPSTARSTDCSCTTTSVPARWTSWPAG